MHALGALGLVLLGCSPVEQALDRPEPPERVPGLDSCDAPTVGSAEVSDPLFDVDVVHEVRFTLDADAETSLTDTPLEYTSAAVELDGTRLDDVGVRLKGNNSFRPLSEKPSWKIRFDAFVDQSYGALRGVTLNNMIEDPTFSREILTYWLWNDAGMLAPRAAYAEVYVNDAYYGLYVLLETYDAAFVQRRFADASGDLWEGEDDADFTAEGVAFFDQKCGDGKRAKLAGIAEALAGSSTDYYARADHFFQMDQLIDYWAWTMATANLDAYPYTLNDYLLYADPAEGGRMTMSPWGMDESWNPEFTFQWGRGVALFDCAADNACLARVEARTELALDHYDDVDVPAKLEALYALSAPSIAPDHHVGWTPLDIETARADLLTFVAGWPAELRAQIAASK